MKYELIIKKLSGHDKTGTIGKMNVKEGDSIKPGDVLFIIESKKGTLKYVSDYDGVIEKLTISEGDTIEKKQVIGIIDGECFSPESCDISTPSETPTKNIPKSSYSFGISKPAKKEFEKDVVIVGGGPGGYVAAIRAAQNGKSVLVVERDRLGGTCLNYGCIPTKAIISSVELFRKIKKADEFGIEMGQAAKPVMKKIIERKESVVNNLVAGIKHLMEKNKIEIIEGNAEVEDETTLIVKNKKLDAKIKFENLIIATGSSPKSIPIEGSNCESILNSESLLELTEIPASMTIIGGGVIGMEFAFIFNSLGTKVNVIEFFPSILNNMDDDVIEVVRESAIENGIKLYENSCATSIKTSLDGAKIVEFRTDDTHNILISDKVAIAVGRTANIESLELDKLGVELNEKETGIYVDEHMRTSKENIYAIGDVTDILQLAHVASHQGIVAADNIAGIESKMRYDNVPSAVFTFPEIGSTGVTEKECKEKEIEYKIGKFPLFANGKAQAMGELEGFVKVIADVKTNQIIGGAIVGIHATDMLSVITNLIESKLTLEKASHVIYAHPTTAESIHEAILSADNKGIHYV